MEKKKKARINRKEEEDLKTLQNGEEIKVSYQFRLTDLPTDILHDILFKLPINSILRTKSVCKEFYNLTTTPIFALNYTKNSPFATIVVNTSVKGIELLEFSSKDDYKESVRTTLTPKLPGLTKERVERFSLNASCDGLLSLCIRQEKIDSDYISNPITGECMLLCQREVQRYRYNYRVAPAYGFGFCRLTNCYKLLRLWKSPICKKSWMREGEIYTVGVDKTWRQLPNPLIPYCSYTHYNECTVVNGVLHWIVIVRNVVYISAFDLGEEKVGRLSHPQGLVMSLFRMKLITMNNQLCLVENSGPLVVIWKMRKYGVAESWTRDVIIDRSVAGLLPVTVYPNGDLLLRCDLRRNLSLYNLTKRKHTELTLSRHDPDGNKVYTLTFLSLKEALKGRHQASAMHL